MDIQTRARNILTPPAQEWRVIAEESSDVASLLRDYAAPLSAISAICRWLGVSIVGVSAPFLGTIRTGIVRGAANAVVTWVFGLVGAWLAAIVIERLAPTFGSRGNTTQALKLVVYSWTPVWIAGVLYLIPPLAPLLLIAALYAIYLFYVGLPIVMHTPADRVVPYIVVSALVVFVVAMCVGLVASAIVTL
jgi:hypothetical protein